MLNILYNRANLLVKIILISALQYYVKGGLNRDTQVCADNTYPYATCTPTISCWMPSWGSSVDPSEDENRYRFDHATSPCQCKEGYYFHQATSSCSPCMSYKGGQVGCYKCDQLVNDYYKPQLYCRSCNEGQYLNPNNQTEEGKPKCNDIPDCDVGKTFDTDLLECVCAEGYSEQPDGSCLLQCNSGHGREPYNNEECRCKDGYKDVSQDLCCLEECATCNTLTECITCQEDHRVWSADENKCVCDVQYKESLVLKICEPRCDVNQGRYYNVTQDECLCQSPLEDVGEDICCMSICSTCSDTTSCDICKTNNTVWDDGSSSCICDTGYEVNEHGDCQSICELDKGWQYHAPASTCICPSPSKDLGGDYCCMEECASCSSTTTCDTCEEEHRVWSTDENECVCDVQYKESLILRNCVPRCDVDEGRYYNVTQDECLCQSPLEDVGEDICCMSVCSACSDTTSCDTCKGDHMVWNSGNSTCICDTGYQDDGHGNCESICEIDKGWQFHAPTSTCICPPPLQDVSGDYCCMAECATCSSTTTCDTCTEDHRVWSSIDSECVCDEGYAEELGVCKVQCKASEGREFDPATTSCVCKNGFYDVGEDLCCLEICETCSSLTECDECLLDNSEWDSVSSSCKCIEGYFLDSSGQCQKCEAPCKKCREGVATSECTSCYNENGFTLDNINHQCHCNSSTHSYQTGSYLCCLKECLYCSTIDTCITCEENRIFENRRCENCSPGYFRDLDDSCQPCQSPCKECVDRADKCTSCDTNTRDLTVNDECVCKGGFKDTGLLKCCDIRCNECLEDGSCKNCNYAHFRYYESGQCVCMGHYYEAPVKQAICEVCHSSCGNCVDNARKCTSCVDTVINFRIDRSLTHNTCPCHNDYEENNLISPKCSRKCLYSCKTCTTNTQGRQVCATCDQDWNRLSLNSMSQCLCKPDYYDLGQSHCCHISCQSCNSNNQCLLCRQDQNRYFRKITPNTSSGRCECLEGYYHKLDDPVCYKCQNFCVKCTDNKNCNLCFPGMELIGTKCQCSLGTYLLQNHTALTFTQSHCQQCDEKCKTCDPLNGKCMICQNEQFLAPECTTKICEDNQILIDQRCVTCKSECQTCTNEHFCTSCKKMVTDDGVDMYEYCRNNNQQFDHFTCRCQTVLFLELQAIELNIDFCPTFCDGCDQQQQCTQCKDSTYQVPLCACKIGQYYSNEEPIGCKPCPSPCTQCNDQEPYKCLLDHLGSGLGTSKIVYKDQDQDSSFMCENDEWLIFLILFIIYVIVSILIYIFCCMQRNKQKIQQQFITQILPADEANEHNSDSKKSNQQQEVSFINTEQNITCNGGFEKNNNHTPQKLIPTDPNIQQTQQGNNSYNNTISYPNIDSKAAINNNQNIVDMDDIDKNNNNNNIALVGINNNKVKNINNYALFPIVSANSQVKKDQIVLIRQNSDDKIQLEKTQVTLHNDSQQFSQFKQSQSKLSKSQENLQNDSQYQIWRAQKEFEKQQYGQLQEQLHNKSQVHDKYDINFKDNYPKHVYTPQKNENTPIRKINPGKLEPIKHSSKGKKGLLNYIRNSYLKEEEDQEQQQHRGIKQQITIKHYENDDI